MRFVPPSLCRVLICSALVATCSAGALADDGKLLATGGVTQLEGQAGGGLVPWALIGGYDTRGQTSATGFFTHVTLPNYTIDSAGVAIGISDTVEFSYARQTLSISNAVTTPINNALKLPEGFLDGSTISQDIYGVKVRVAGKAVYDQNSWLPQIAVGAQFKANTDFNIIPATLGAKRSSSTDFYLAATKIFLDGPFHYPLLIDANVRETRGNTLGLLGFGGDKNQSYTPEFEGSAALLLSRNTAVGVEYRTNPDNLSATREDAYKDLFFAFLPNKTFSITAAYADLGNLPSGFSAAGITKQQSAGLYLSANVSI